MTLAEFLKKRGISYAAFGRRIGRATSTVRRYCLPAGDPHRRLPDEAGMVEVYRLTGGQVTPNDFYELPPLPEAAANGEAREAMAP